MEKIEKILEKAYKNNKTIKLDEILKLNLGVDTYNAFIKELQTAGIKIIENSNIELSNENCFYSNSLKQYLKEISMIPLLTTEEERQLFYDYAKTKDPKIKDKIISANLRLVVSVVNDLAWKTKNTSLEYLDLIQAGNEGLIKSIDKYDINKGCKFSTYSIWWIKRMISKTLIDTGTLIRIPEGLYNTYDRIKKYKAEKIQADGTEPTTLDAAEALNIKTSKALKAEEFSQKKFVSIDQSMDDETNCTRLEFIVSDMFSLEDRIISQYIYEQLMIIMDSTLTERECFIISARLGLINKYNNCDQKMTLNAIGQMIGGIGREAVRQSLEKAYKKLKFQCRQFVDDSRFMFK